VSFAAQIFQLSTQILELAAEFVDLVLHAAQFLSDAGHGTFHVHLVLEMFAALVGFLLEAFGNLMHSGGVEVIDSGLEVVQLLFERFRALGWLRLGATTLAAIDFAFEFRGGIESAVGAEFTKFAVELA
jgi:hypothetical protein